MTIQTTHPIPAAEDTLQDTVSVLESAMALGMPVPVLVGMQGWVLTIDQWDNDSEYFRAHTTVHRTQAEAERELANWVVEQWREYYSDEDWNALEEEGFLPLSKRSDADIIERHFDSKWSRDMHSIVFVNVAPPAPRFPAWKSHV